MADAIRLILTNVPAILFVAALLIAWLSHTPASGPERFLAWLLLLTVGVESLWAGVYHVFFPATAAAFIGWQVSPFQFEIGVADLAIGATAVVSFWRGLEFKSAVVCYTILFYAGVAVGHVRQAWAAGDAAPGNFGLLLLMTLVKIVLLAGLLQAARRAGPLTRSVGPATARGPG
ncbi:MAG: DUF6790 family protein [Microvirga sp.]